MKILTFRHGFYRTNHPPCYGPTDASNMFNKTVHDHGYAVNTGTVNNVPENMRLLEKAVFDKMMKDKEIAFLTGAGGEDVRH